MFAVTIAALIAFGGRAAADPAGDLAAAQRHFDELDYELVAKSVDAVVAAPDATPRDKVKALYLRGSALVVLDRDADAAAAFDDLLAIDPDFHPPAAVPPRIRAAFEAARAGWRVHVEEELATRYGAQLHDVTLDVTPAPAARGGRSFELHVHLADPHHLVARVVLGFRRETDRDYSLVSQSAAPELALSIPGALLASDRDYRLAWYVQAVHAGGAALRRAGDETDPRWTTVTRGQTPRPPPITKRWWFWTGAAALALSAVAVPILIDQARPVGPQRIMVGGP